MSTVVRRPTVGRPDWFEVVLGLTIFGAVGFGGGSQLYRLALTPTANGLIFTGLSGVAGLLAFAGAFLLRIRNVAAFGIRKTTFSWLLLAVIAGIAAFLVKGLLAFALSSLFQATENVQQVYGTAGSGGLLSLALATFCLAVFTPIGEEFLFRGVVTSAWLRFGPSFAVTGSATVFAAAHGWNSITPSAFVEGLVAAELFRRSESIWTAVVVHIVFNLPTVPFLVLRSLG